MRQSTQRKALAAVLGLGAVALLVDKLVLGPADAAGATRAAEAAPRDDAGGSIASPTLPPLPATPSRVRQTLLAALNIEPGGWDDEDIRASLRPTPAWALYADPEPAKPAPAKSPEGRFCEKYRLKGVMGREESVAALVETVGQKQPAVLQLGSELDGFKLVRVENGIAYFKAGAQHVELTVSPVPDKP